LDGCLWCEEDNQIVLLPRYPSSSNKSAKRANSKRHVRFDPPPFSLRTTTNRQLPTVPPPSGDPSSIELLPEFVMLRTTLSRQGRLRLSARSTFSSARTSPSIAVIPLSPLSSSSLPVRTSSLFLTTLRSYSTTPPASAPSPSPSPVLSSPFRRLFRRRPSSSSSSSPRISRKPLPKYSLPLGILLFILISTASYELIPPTRHFALAIIRCSVLMQAVIADAIDYKLTWRKSTEGMSLEEVRKVHSDCHKRSAERLLKSLEVSLAPSVGSVWR
jgi:hypothetical protein